jgi:Na+-driven multidrug efflux pump
VRVPGAYAVGLLAGLGLFGAWTAVGADMVLRGVLLTRRFTQATWTRTEV